MASKLDRRRADCNKVRASFSHQGWINNKTGLGVWLNLLSELKSTGIYNLIPHIYETKHSQLKFSTQNVFIKDSQKEINNKLMKMKKEQK